MGRKCCAPHCRGNYNPQNKVSVFKFPTDEEEKKKWIAGIGRENFRPSKQSVVHGGPQCCHMQQREKRVPLITLLKSALRLTLTGPLRLERKFAAGHLSRKVCELHFDSADIIRTVVIPLENGTEMRSDLQKPRLVRGAVPINITPCLNKKNDRKCRGSQQVESTIEESAADYKLQIEDEDANLSPVTIDTELLRECCRIPYPVASKDVSSYNSEKEHLKKQTDPQFYSEVSLSDEANTGDDPQLPSIDFQMESQSSTVAINHEYEMKEELPIEKLCLQEDIEMELKFGMDTLFGFDLEDDIENAVLIESICNDLFKVESTM